LQTSTRKITQRHSFFCQRYQNLLGQLNNLFLFILLPFPGLKNTS
jgi:hypothetical protein